MERNTRTLSIFTHETFRWNEKQGDDSFLRTKRSDGTKGKTAIYFHPRDVPMERKQEHVQFLPTRRSDGTKSKNNIVLPTIYSNGWKYKGVILRTRRSDGTKGNNMFCI
jgi:hypothetical protein